jgi:hypothetical protein
MRDRDLVERIRTIFLHDPARVTVNKSAYMLGWTAPR